MPTTTYATTSYAPVDDPGTAADLLVRVSHGDPAAWAEVLRRYGKLVSTTVRSFRLQDAEQRVIDADTARTLRKFVDELPPRRRTLRRALFNDHPCPYAEVARAAGISLGGIGPTRARALRQLRNKLNEYEYEYEYELGPGAC